MSDDKRESLLGWERDLISRLAVSALKEQRAARRWGVFFKLMLLAYVSLILVAGVVGGMQQFSAGDEAHVGLVRLNGTIAKDEVSAEQLIGSLRNAFDAPGSEAVVMLINSPGGSPVQSDAVFHAMRKIREDYPAKALYAVIEDMAASGGYYIAVGADKIYAANGSLVGSIGVRMGGFGFVELMEKLGIERRILTAGDNKALFDPFSPVNEKELDHLQGLLQDLHSQFIDVVRLGRGERLIEDQDPLFGGLIWTGRRALELGLIDGIGTLDTLVQDELKDLPVYDYSFQPELLDRVTQYIGSHAKASIRALGMPW